MIGALANITTKGASPHCCEATTLLNTVDTYPNTTKTRTTTCEKKKEGEPQLGGGDY